MAKPTIEEILIWLKRAEMAVRKWAEENDTEEACDRDDDMLAALRALIERSDVVDAPECSLMKLAEKQGVPSSA